MSPSRLGIASERHRVAHGKGQPERLINGGLVHGRSPAPVGRKYRVSAALIARCVGDCRAPYIGKPGRNGGLLRWRAAVQPKAGFGAAGLSVRHGDVAAKEARPVPARRQAYTVAKCLLAGGRQADEGAPRLNVTRTCRVSRPACAFPLAPP